MSYYFSKSLNIPFGNAVARVTEALKSEGFGILTEIDVKDALKKKLDVEEFRNYRILGACNPPFAYKALQAEDKIGTMLPCNVIVQERDGGVDGGRCHRPRGLHAGSGKSRPPPGGRGSAFKAQKGNRRPVTGRVVMRCLRNLALRDSVSRPRFFRPSL